jgi:ABC-type multidrug transport system ATPase subunit
MRSQPYLQISKLSKRYGSISALSEVDFALERGNVLAVLGPNGAGKSTLFGCLLRLAWPTNGRILKEGKPIDEFDAAKLGHVPERIALYPHRTVEENATFFASLKGQSVEAVERQLDRVGLLAVSKRKVRQLSKGMLQRLGLAIALCGEPELMVLDEPFNGLDPALLETLQSILREERERGATLLISTHTISAVEPLATHVVILLQGKLAAFGELAALRQQNDFDSLECLYGRIARNSRIEEEVLG